MAIHEPVVTRAVPARFGLTFTAIPIGAKAHAQWIDQDSRSKNLQLIGGNASTPDAELVLGR